MMIRKKRNLKSGQVMILAVLTIGSSLLAVSLIASMLVIFQIRQAGSAADSAKALFAADSGVGFYLKNKTNFSTGVKYDSVSDNPGLNTNLGLPKVIFENGAAFEIEALTGREAKVIGRFGNSKRAFLISVSEYPIACEDESDVMFVVSRPDPANKDTLTGWLKDFTGKLETDTAGNFVRNKIALVDYDNSNAALLSDFTNNKSNIESAFNNIGLSPKSTALTADLNKALSLAEPKINTGDGIKDYLIIILDRAPIAGSESDIRNTASNLISDGVTIIYVTPDKVAEATDLSDIASDPSLFFEPDYPSLFNPPKLNPDLVKPCP